MKKKDIHVPHINPRKVVAGAGVVTVLGSSMAVHSEATEINPEEPVGIGQQSATGTHEVTTLVYSKQIKNDVFLKLHPDFGGWTGNTDRTVFWISKTTTKSTTMNVTYNGKVFNAGVTYYVGTAANKGTAIFPKPDTADTNRKFTRLEIWGDQYYKKYKTVSYNNATGQVVSTRYFEKIETSGTYNQLNYSETN